MARDFAKEFYHSIAWLKTRDFVLHRDLHLCQRCREKGKLTPAETVHHIIELTPQNIDDVRISLDPKNLISLCRDCHAEVHRQYKDGERYSIDEFGNIEIPDDDRT